jgi:hypothetical protein
MSFGQSVLTGAFCISVVFSVLVVLWLLIRIFSVIIRSIERGGASGAQTPQGQK